MRGDLRAARVQCLVKPAQPGLKFDDRPSVFRRAAPLLVAGEQPEHVETAGPLAQPMQIGIVLRDVEQCL